MTTHGPEDCPRCAPYCPCTPADVAVEEATSPGRNGVVIVTGRCEHGRVVAQTHDSIL